MESDIDRLKKVSCDAIDFEIRNLEKLSHFIWSNPELSFQEVKSHDILTSFLSDRGFDVKKRYPLETSFVAEFGNNNENGFVIGICCEYDALPGIGHACGHNLIAESSVAAGLGVKAALQSTSTMNGKIIIYGTPAEETGGGKAEMLKAKVFDKADVCMMAHPACYDLPDPVMVAVSQFKIEFKGKPSHAAAAPWDGINALDAAVECYNNISLLRQQTKTSSRIHSVILKGGNAPNIIPEFSEMSIFVRAVADKEMLLLKDKVIGCAKGAALATGCSIKVIEVAEYNALNSNRTLLDLYTKNSEQLGVCFNHTGSKQGGSTDMGNVSVYKPSIHPKFKIDSTSNPHTSGFCEAAILASNQMPTITVAKSLAMTAIDVLVNRDLMPEILKYFNKK